MKVRVQGVLALALVFWVQSLEASGTGEFLVHPSLAPMPHLPPVRVTFQIPDRVNLLTMAEDGQLALATPVGTESFYLEEFASVLPGENVVRIYDQSGHLSSEAPYLGRTFRGYSLPAGEPAVFLFSPNGIFGIWDSGGRSLSLAPLEGLSDAYELYVPGDFPHKIQDVRGRMAAPDVVNYELWVLPWADHSYVTYTSQWADRITLAYAYSDSITMWESETNTRVKRYAISDSGRTFDSTNESCDPHDIGLNDFRETWLDTRSQIGPNVYGLFFASENTSGVNGCANVGCDVLAIYGCLQNANPGQYTVTAWASHAVQGKDWDPNNDAYDPDAPVHLAKVLHQEITHNAGEQNHPTDGSSCNYNIMHSAVSIDCRGFWRVGGPTSTVHKVKFYGEPRFKHV